MCTHTHTHVLGGEGWENEVGGKSQFIHTYCICTYICTAH